MNIVEATRAAREQHKAMRRPHWDTNLRDGEKYFPKCFFPTNGHGATLQTADSFYTWIDHAEFSAVDLLAEDWELCELPFTLDHTVALFGGMRFDNSEELMTA